MKIKRVDEKLDFLVEMADAGGFSANGNYYHVIVHPREMAGTIPHFHLHANGTSYNDDICIKFDTPEYFIHGNHKDTLNAKGRKNLQEFIISERRGISRWDFLVDAWESAYPDSPVKSLSCPDYRYLPDKL